MRRFCCDVSADRMHSSRMEKMIPRLTNTPAPSPLYAAFLAELRTRGFAGDLSLTHADRTVLATDNSIYQLTPQAIAFPRDADDLVRIARAAQDPRFADVKLAPRGGGTGTNGQSLTDGLVVDVSRHMNRILEINVAERWARVEAGRGQGPAQRRPRRARPVLPAGALDLEPRHHRRNGQHGRLRPGLVPLREDAQPRPRADHRPARRHGLALEAARRRRSWPRSSGAPTGSAPSTGSSRPSHATRRT